MAEFEQMEMDVRLDSERELAENVSILLEFAFGQLQAETPAGNKVKNRFEGYGILADSKTEIDRDTKELSDSMKNLLQSLQGEDKDVISPVQRIDSALAALVTSAVKMSAQAHRINEDLYTEYAATTPLEEYAEAINEAFEETEEKENEE